MYRFYARKAWGEEKIVISFTVPDEQTFVDWATPQWKQIYAAPQEWQIETFDGGRLHTKDVGEHLSAGECSRGPKYITAAVYEKSTRRVYFHQYTNPNLEN